MFEHSDMLKPKKALFGTVCPNGAFFRKEREQYRKEERDTVVPAESESDAAAIGLCGQ